MNVRAELKSILEQAYNMPVRAQTLNKIIMVIDNAVTEAKRAAQDEQAREVFGRMSVDDLE